ncbi:hypothetical protein RUM44_011316 [Polyplax serrata]|uniref:Uncharacterized protein n=1 Tax=Polyplax serrata TaxID=468196 RepID=A0ABR1APN8_POLSC
MASSDNERQRKAREDIGILQKYTRSHSNPDPLNGIPLQISYNSKIEEVRELFNSSQIRIPDQEVPAEMSITGTKGEDVN